MVCCNRRGGSNTNGEYRYGFQGQEKDTEMHGEGEGKETYAYKYRIHDPRLGRFLSVDPLSPEYPWNSPYAFSENRVIDGVELEGLEYLDYKISYKLKTATQEFGDDVGSIPKLRLWNGDNELSSRDIFYKKSYLEKAKSPNPNFYKNNTGWKTTDYEFHKGPYEISGKLGSKTNKPFQTRANNVIFAHENRFKRGSASADAFYSFMESVYNTTLTYSALENYDRSIIFESFKNAANVSFNNQNYVFGQFYSLNFGNSDVSVLNFNTDVINYMVSGDIECVNYNGYSRSEFKNYKNKVYQTGQKSLDENGLNFKIKPNATFWNSLYQNSWIKGWVDGPPGGWSGDED